METGKIQSLPCGCYFECDEGKGIVCSVVGERLVVYMDGRELLLPVQLTLCKCSLTPCEIFSGRDSLCSNLSTVCCMMFLKNGHASWVTEFLPSPRNLSS